MKSTKQHKRAKEILTEAGLQMCYMFDWDRSIIVCNPSDYELVAITTWSFFSSPSMKPWNSCTFLLDNILLVGVNLIHVWQKTQDSYKCFYSKCLCNWIGSSSTCKNRLPSGEHHFEGKTPLFFILSFLWNTTANLT